MAHLFRNKENKKLYTIAHLLVDLKFLDLGGRTGIYATPYGWKGKEITHTKDGAMSKFNPKKFVTDNFDIVGEMW